MSKKNGDIDQLFSAYNKALEDHEDTQPVIDEAKRTLYAEEFKEFIGVIETLEKVIAVAKQERHFRLITRLKEIRDETYGKQDGGAE